MNFIYTLLCLSWLQDLQFAILNVGDLDFGAS